MNNSTEILAPGQSGYYTNYRMAHGETCAFDLDKSPVAAADESLRRFGVNIPEVGRVVTGSNRESLHFLDTRGWRQRPYIWVVGNRFDGRDQTGRPNCIDLEVGVPVEIGRHPQDASDAYFDHTGYMSRYGYELFFDGSSVTVTNHTPMNPTRLTGHLIGRDTGKRRRLIVPDENREEPHPDDGLIHAGYTDNVVRDLSDGNFTAEAPNGYFHFEGRTYPIIGRNSPTIKGGVYLTTSSESILVDDWSEELQASQWQIVEDIYERIGRGESMSVRKMLIAVKDATRLAMPNNVQAVNALCEPYYYNNGIIKLSKFRRRRIGVCRTENLDAVLQVEAIIKAKLLRGRTAVERSHDLRDDYGHGWGILEEPGTTDPLDVWVVDPAQDFVGTKRDALLRGKHNYTLPTY